MTDTPTMKAAARGIERLHNFIRCSFNKHEWEDMWCVESSQGMSVFHDRIQKCAHCPAWREQDRFVSPNKWDRIAPPTASSPTEKESE